MTDDAGLLEEWRGGDRRAGGALVERHFRTVYRFFSRKIVDSDVVEELAQRTFLAAVEGEQRIRDGTRFKAFVLAIARNLLVDHWRREAAAERRPVHDTPPTAPTSPSSRAARQEEQRILLVAIRLLPRELQLVLEMHYWEELTTREIGHVLDMPSGTVKWKLARARREVEKQIQRVARGVLAESTIRDFEQWAASLRDA